MLLKASEQQKCCGDVSSVKGRLPSSVEGKKDPTPTVHSVMAGVREKMSHIGTLFPLNISATITMIYINPLRLVSAIFMPRHICVGPPNLPNGSLALNRCVCVQSTLHTESNHMKVFVWANMDGGQEKV